MTTNLEELVDPVLEVVQKNFGISYLYPWQRMVIENILEAFEFRERSNQIILLPTGAGKSLCFMTPALLLPGPTLIIYPLLALMNDQERRIRESNMEVVIFKGGQTDEERKQNIQKIQNGAKFILANPEVLKTKQLLQTLATCNISHIAIDEAHCVAEWGDSFRPAYLELTNILKTLNVPAVSAFTATASQEVLDRMAEILFEGSAHIVRSEADRPNIYYAVEHVFSKEKALLYAVMREQRPLIAFCSSRNRCQTLALLLIEFLSFYNEQDTVRFYHAGLSREEKSTVEKWFFPKKNAILVATCAFGMGVDKSDIRTVIHYDPPQVAEAYIQEAGRGGRDRKPARAILFWSPEDSERLKQYPPQSRLRVLEHFATKGTCRRQILLDALSAEQAACNGCDICDKTAIQINQEVNTAQQYAKKYKKTKNFSKQIQTCYNTASRKKLGINIWQQQDIKKIKNFLTE